MFPNKKAEENRNVMTRTSIPCPGGDNLGAMMNDLGTILQEEEIKMNFHVSTVWITDKGEKFHLFRNCPHLIGRYKARYEYQRCKTCDLRVVREQQQLQEAQFDRNPEITPLPDL